MALVEHTLFGTVDKVQEAVKVLKEYEPPEGYYVCFSGGKDSLVVYWLTKIAGVKCDYHYRFTTVDPPELVQFVRTFEDVQIHHPGTDKTMWALIVKHSAPPNRWRRYCCDELKEKGSRERLKIVGVRAEESAKRKGREVVQLDSPLGRMINLIYHWTLLDVWEFIGCNLIDYCSLYDEGFDRLGCIGCPLQSAKGMERDFERWPLYRKAYLRSFEQMLKERKRKGLETKLWKDAEDVMRQWIYGKEKEQKGQLTFDHFRGLTKMIEDERGEP